MAQRRTGRVRADAPNGDLHGYVVRDSSNVNYVGWQDGDLLVWFKNGGGVYKYKGVTVQRAVALALAPSVGKYLNRYIKRQYAVVKIA